MQFDIKIFEVKIENKGKYDLLTVDYKDLRQDKNSTKKVVSFTNKDVFNTLKGASSGDEFTVTAVKGEQYWEWQNVSPRGQAPADVPSGGSSSAASKPAAASPKSTYETPEERAKKQLYIVRQSSIGAAINLLKTEKVIPSVADVLATAKQFESYVFGVTEMPANINSLPPLPNDDDIPL